MQKITKDDFIKDRQGRTFTDVWDDAEKTFGSLLAFFNDKDRQRRMEEAETHHDRPALAGVVRELEAQNDINEYLALAPPARAKRLRQAIGVLVRMIMEGRGWKKTGRKGSLGVRNNNLTPAVKLADKPETKHNTGGLSFWFLRAERYQLPDGQAFLTVKQRCHGLEVS